MIASSVTFRRPCTHNNLRPTFIGTLPALSYARNREGLADGGRFPATEDGQKRHDRGLSVFTYSPTYPLITDCRGCARRLFVPIPSGCSSHEHSRGSNSEQ